MSASLSDVGHALLTTAQLAPNDDHARLVFADWLDENAHERAAARLRFWVRLRGEVRREVMNFDTALTGASADDSNRWVRAGNQAFQAISREWLRELCGAEVERLAALSQDFSLLMHFGLQSIREVDGISVLRPFFADWEWEAVGCCPKTDRPDLTSIVGELAQPNRGIAAVRFVSYCGSIALAVPSDAVPRALLGKFEWARAHAWRVATVAARQASEAEQLTKHPVPE